MAKDHSPKFLQIVDDAKSRITEIEPERVRERIASESDFHLVDVREDREFAEMHIEGAEHLGKGVIERDVEKRYPDMQTPLALYCGGGFRSALAADQLQKMGYEHVYSVAGGFRALKKAGFEVVSE